MRPIILLILTLVIGAAPAFGGILPVSATPIGGPRVLYSNTFSASDAFGRSATASFYAVDTGLGYGQLSVTLTNSSLADVLQSDQVLTALFFNTQPVFTSMTPASAYVVPGSTRFFDASGSNSGSEGGNVGGVWAYAGGLPGGPANCGFGLSSFDGGMFGAPNLNGPDTVTTGGLFYGITSAGDDLATGSSDVTGNYALIRNSVVFTLFFNPAEAFSVYDISFQYGTTLRAANLESTPAPGAAMLAWLGICSIAGLHRRFVGRPE